MTEPNDCDNGWIHLCGGPHDTVMTEVPTVDPETNETKTDYVSTMVTPFAEGGCRTVRCDTHCSCFCPDGVHHPECALATQEPSNG